LQVHWVLPSFGIQNNAEAIAHLVGVLVPAIRAISDTDADVQMNFRDI